MKIVHLAALLHDISMPSAYGDRGEHHIFSAEMSEALRSTLNYSEDRIALVKKCVINHSGRNTHFRNTIEEVCISDADALAHFDRIPSLFSLAYSVLNMGLDEGRNYVKERLQDDLNGLSERTKQLHQHRITELLNNLFVD